MASCVSASIPVVRKRSSRGPLAVDHTERGEARPGQRGRGLHEPLQERIEGQLGRDRDAGLDQCPQAILIRQRRAHESSVTRSGAGNPHAGSVTPPMPGRRASAIARDDRKEEPVKALVYHGPGFAAGKRSPTRPSGIRPTQSSHRLGHDLRHRPPHPQGRRPRGRAGNDPRPRGRRHSRRDRRRGHDARAGRPRARVVHHVVRALLVLQGRPIRPLHGRRRLDLRAPDRRPPGRVRARAASPTPPCTRCRRS